MKAAAVSHYLARRACWTCGILTARRDLGARLHHTDHLHETTATLDQPGRRVAA